MKFVAGFGIAGSILIILITFLYCRGKDYRRRSSSSSIESFQQLYFTKTPYNQINNLDQRVIERWSSIDRQPSLTFYR